MKKILVIFSLMLSLFHGVAQNKESEIYIQLKNQSDFELISSGGVDHFIQLFILKERINRVQKTIIKTESGIIKQTITVPSSNEFLSQITLKYENKSDKNPPRLVRHDNLKNILFYPQDFEGVEFNKLVNELHKFESIYVIDGIYPDIIYKVKKVTLK